VFSRKSISITSDLRGVVVGLDGAPLQLLKADFKDLQGTNVDASECRVSCSFTGARIDKSKFDVAVLDTCRFKGAKFDRTSFDEAKIDSPTLDDAEFLKCSFLRAKITGRGFQEYGGRRFVFEECDFRGAAFRNLQLRASVFRDCNFEGVTFSKCLMVGVKFEGSRPDDGSIVDCIG
jgi:uncharacterized protein YjbI with pentapeptide repeats